MSNQFEIDNESIRPQWGCKRPNGVIVWDEPGDESDVFSLANEQRQGAAQDEHRATVEAAGITWQDAYALTFVRRETATAHTAVKEMK